MWVRFERDLAEKTLVVQEKIGGQDALPIALLEQIARRFRGTPKRVFGVGLLTGLKVVAGFLRLQLVKKLKTGL